MSRYVAVTGAAGFIGKHLTRKLLEAGHYVYAIDALTYAADPDAIAGFQSNYRERFTFVSRDIRDLGRLPDVDSIIHLAAETHVDNSFSEASRFVETNVNGTLHLLEMTRAKFQHGMPHFYHISTDEVYGPIEQGKAGVCSPLRPSSPYAASKAAADHLVEAWGETFGLPYTIIRPTNCYGRGQYPEKLIPKAVRSLMLGRPIPVHGDGSMTRQWLHVEDLADAIMLLLDIDAPPVVNISGNTEASVMCIANRIAEIMDFQGESVRTDFVRPAVDTRYSVDDSWIRTAGWKPKGKFWSDLTALVAEERQRFRF